MLDAPTVLETAARPCALIHLTIAKAEIREAMGPGIREVFAALEAQGIAPAGPWFAHHLRMDSESWDFEICVPVASPVRPVGRVVPGELRAARVARTTHHGPYEGLPSAWRKFSDWMKAEGHQPAPDLWEVYATGPESDPDPANWRTELNKPLMD